MLTNYCYQTDIRFQSLNCPVPSPLLCGFDIGYSGIKIQSPCNVSIIPSIVLHGAGNFIATMLVAFS